METGAELVAAAQRLVADGLCVGTAGNLSVRVDGGLLITPSGLDPARMSEADLVLVGDDGRVVEGSRAPSSELAMHLMIYRATDARAVVHTHAPFATALSTTLDELPAIHYLIVRLGGPVRVAGYALFGTEDLARELEAALAGRSAALLQNHGAVSVGATLAEAYERAVLLEWLCSLHWHAAVFGRPHLLSEAELDGVRAQLTRLHYGEQG